MLSLQTEGTVIPGPWPSQAPAVAAAPAPAPRLVGAVAPEASSPRPAAPPHGQERRKDAPPTAPELLRAGLTPPQLVTLEAMEIFRWRLAFVRRPLFQPPIPVLFDQDNTRHVVIREDGTLDEQPTLKLRG